MGNNISNARKLQFCKQPFEIIQGQIAFKNTVQSVNKQPFEIIQGQIAFKNMVQCVNKQTVVLSPYNGV